MGRLQVPVVRRHDEVPAMLRVMVAVRPQRIFRHQRAPVDRASPGTGLVHLLVDRAGERQRLDDLHQLAAADAAPAGLPVGDCVEVQLAAPHQIEPHRDQIHTADRTLAAAIVDHFRMHRAGP